MSNKSFLNDSRTKNTAFKSYRQFQGKPNLQDIRDHSFKTSACLRGGGVSPCADGPKVTVHKDQKSPS